MFTKGLRWITDVIYENVFNEKVSENKVKLSHFSLKISLFFDK